MDFSLPYQAKDNHSHWTDVLFYISVALLIGVIFCYGIFSINAYIQTKKSAELDQQMAVYAASSQKNSEALALSYKKKIDDFTTIVNSHKISLNLLNVIEQNTLPDIWFTSFNASEVTNQIDLLGEAQSMETISRQVAIFENDKQDIDAISVLSSQVASNGKIQFILKLSLNPKMLDYTNPEAN